MTKITTDEMTDAEAFEILESLVTGGFRKQNYVLESGDAYSALKHIAARLSSTSFAPDGWQPIETAPKNGGDIQVYCSSSNEQFSAYWHIGREVWCYAITREGVLIACNPTHWRRQAAAPQPVVEKDNG